MISHNNPEYHTILQTDTKLSLEKKIDELSDKLGEALTSIKKKDESIMVGLTSDIQTLSICLRV